MQTTSVASVCVVPDLDAMDSAGAVVAVVGLLVGGRKWRYDLVGVDWCTVIGARYDGCWHCWSSEDRDGVMVAEAVDLTLQEGLSCGRSPCRRWSHEERVGVKVGVDVGSA